MPVHSVISVDVRVDGDLAAIGLIDTAAPTPFQILWSSSDRFNDQLIQAALLSMVATGMPPELRVKLLSVAALLLGMVDDEPTLPF